MAKPEDKIQAECYKWFHNAFPQYRKLLCYNLNNPKHGRQGGIDKQMGLQKGRNDLTFYFCSVASLIEMKTPVGSQSTAQKEFEAHLKKYGFNYYIARTLKEFQILIYNLIFDGYESN